ncbi:MAG: hypothetical protein H0X30_00385, partial [Anaerolineae bacterium]|nr:hypothetical protein [Anaerolineae bacterium]
MTNELATFTSTAIQPMTSARRAANLEALLSSLSNNTRAQIASTWRMYSTWCASQTFGVWGLDAVQALAFLTAHPARPSTQRARLSHLRTVMGLHADTSGDEHLQFRVGLLQRLKLPGDADSLMSA